MLHHDAVFCPTEAQQTSKSSSQKSVANQSAHLAYLDKNPYTEVDADDLGKVQGLCALKIILFDFSVKINVGIRI